jgi:hypothetical protein
MLGLMTRRMRAGMFVAAAYFAAAALCLAPSAPACAAADAQAHFATPDLAVQAFVDAVRGNHRRRLLEILGPDGRKLVYSGDKVADRLGREKFAAAYDQMHRIDRQGDDRAALIIGDKAWSFPIPLVKSHERWRFDTEAGAQEILDRRIGRNELGAIEVCRAFVDAQRDYAAQDRDGNGLLEYAQHLLSTPGKHDGLYWPADGGAAESPMGPLMASARAEGYADGKEALQPRQPYHGYLYRILDRQGKHAPDGARDYRVNGHMIGGFALVAFPARYGDSGIMTFIVNQDDVVYEKNLGPDTQETVQRLSEFDPDPSWTKVPPESAAGK